MLKRMHERLWDSKGQTTSEYLVIGAVAAMIVLGLLTVFNDGFQAAVKALAASITGAVTF